MAFALPLFAHLFELAQLVSLPRARARTESLGARRAAPAARSGTVLAANDDAPPRQDPTPQRSWGGPIRTAPLQRPLRVLRVVEGRAGGVCAGRMVISGRMADVCAEIDRLAELETRHH